MAVSPSSSVQRARQELADRLRDLRLDAGLISTPLAARTPAYDVRCLNPDGSEATMCGNALRCAALSAAADHGHTEVSMLMAGVWHRGKFTAPRSPSRLRRVRCCAPPRRSATTAGLRVRRGAHRH